MTPWDRQIEAGSIQAASLAHRLLYGRSHTAGIKYGVFHFSGYHRRMNLPAPSSSSGRNGVLIVGGGLVGASLAIALDAAGIAATLVEAAAPRADAQPSYDERNLALARATVNGLDAIGVWRHASTLAPRRSNISTSAEPANSAARASTRTARRRRTGLDLPARELGSALLRRLDECTRLTRLAPATWWRLSRRPMAGVR
jgi:2-octaprenyl-6-methoxyphenol hydroxylase